MLPSRFPHFRIPLKQTDPISWVASLQNYIQTAYQDDPQRHLDSIVAFNRMRLEMADAKPSAVGRDIVYQYFLQLDHLDRRLPQHYDSPQIEFCWRGAFDGQPTVQSAIAFEKASVTYNLAAILAMYAVELLTSGEGDASYPAHPQPSPAAASPLDHGPAAAAAAKDPLIEAYIHFECAAKQFKNISDNYQYAPSFELRPETNQALCQAMLAQAYECLYIRCISQGLRSSIIAKVSNQVSRAYEVLIGLLDQLDAPLIPLGWTLVAKTKNKYYLALAQLKLAETIQTKGQHGEAVTRLSLAMKHIDQAKKDAKGFTVGIFSTEDPSESLCPSNTQDFIEACESLAATIKSSYENAKHENEIVYHMDEPRIEDLEPIPHPGDKLGSIKPEEMIKLYDRDDRDVPDFLSKNLFRTLIPLDIHEQSSLYSEEKAKLLRTEVERTAYAEDELNQTLSFMRYPGCIRKFEYSLQRPGSADPANPTVRTPPLRERIIAELSEPSVELAQEAQRVQEAEQQDSLASQLERVDQVRNRATLELNKVGELLNQEQLESNRLLTAYADVIGFSLSPSSSVNVEYRNSFKLYRQNLDAAAESDKALRHRYNTLVESYIDALRQGREGVRAALSYHITSGLEKSDTGQLGVGGVNTESLLDVGEDQPVGLGGYVDAVKATYQRLAQIQQERQAVMADFKRKVHEERDDEVIERLLSYDMRGQHQSENREKLFAQSLEKFQPYTHRLQALNSKQVLLLKQFTTEFRELMDSASARLVQKQWDAAEILRNQFSEMLLSAIHSYHELVDTARKAIEFYRQLSESTTDLHVRTTQFVESRTMERSAMIKKIEDNKSLSEHVALKKRLEQYKVLPSAPSEHGSANGSNNGSTYVDERRDVATSYYSSASIPIALTAPTAPGADIATLGSSDLPSSSYYGQQQQQQQYRGYGSQDGQSADNGAEQIVNQMARMNVGPSDSQHTHRLYDKNATHHQSAGDERANPLTAITPYAPSVPSGPANYSQGYTGNHYHSQQQPQAVSATQLNSSSAPIQPQYQGYYHQQQQPNSAPPAAPPAQPSHSIPSYLTATHIPQPLAHKPTSPHNLHASAPAAPSPPLVSASIYSSGVDAIQPLQHQHHHHQPPPLLSQQQQQQQQPYQYSQQVTNSAAVQRDQAPSSPLRHHQPQQPQQGGYPSLMSEAFPYNPMVTTIPVQKPALLPPDQKYTSESNQGAHYGHRQSPTGHQQFLPQQAPYSSQLSAEYVGTSADYSHSSSVNAQPGLPANHTQQPQQQPPSKAFISASSSGAQSSGNPSALPSQQQQQHYYTQNQQSLPPPPQTVPQHQQAQSLSFGQQPQPQQPPAPNTVSSGQYQQYGYPTQPPPPPLPQQSSQYGQSQPPILPPPQNYQAPQQQRPLYYQESSITSIASEYSAPQDHGESSGMSMFGNVAPHNHQQLQPPLTSYGGGNEYQPQPPKSAPQRYQQQSVHQQHPPPPPPPMSGGSAMPAQYVPPPMFQANANQPQQQQSVHYPPYDNRQQHGSSVISAYHPQVGGQYSGYPQQRPPPPAPPAPPPQQQQQLNAGPATSSATSGGGGYQAPPPNPHYPYQQQQQPPPPPPQAQGLGYQVDSSAPSYQLYQQTSQQQPHIGGYNQHQYSTNYYAPQQPQQQQQYAPQPQHGRSNSQFGGGNGSLMD